MGKKIKRVLFKRADGKTFVLLRDIPEPTEKELEALVPHNCSTCEFREFPRPSCYCGVPSDTFVEDCKQWDFDVDAYTYARQEWRRQRGLPLHDVYEVSKSV